MMNGIKNADIPNHIFMNKFEIYAPKPPIMLLIFSSNITSESFFPEIMLSSACHEKKKEINEINKYVDINKIRLPKIL